MVKEIVRYNVLKKYEKEVNDDYAKMLDSMMRAIIIRIKFFKKQAR